MGSDLIRGPVGRVIGLVVWMAVFSLLLGSVNQWYLQSVDAGVIGNERFDRVVLKGTGDLADADKAWANVTSHDSDGFEHTYPNPATASSINAFYKYTPDGGVAYGVIDNGGACEVGRFIYGGSNTGLIASSHVWFTPSGTEVKTPGEGPTVSPGDPVEVSGCKYEEASDIFGAGGLAGLIKIILQAAGIAPPIALLFVLGTFGSSFLRNLGGHPILAAVGTIILMLLLATLLNTLVPFLSTAFSAIDGNRFRMYEEGLGSISVIVGNFFGVVLVAGMLMVIWNAVKYFKGHDALGSEGKM